MSASPTLSPIDKLVQSYGDTLFDLCESLLWDPAQAQIAFREVIQALKKSLPANGYIEHERAWVLRTACDRLKHLSLKNARRITPTEQIQLDSTQGVSNRIKQFEFFFHRLSDDDQLVLLLRDKYGLPYSEIASALDAPEGSLKVRRGQALRSLDEWLWDQGGRA